MAGRLQRSYGVDHRTNAPDATLAKRVVYAWVLVAVGATALYGLGGLFGASACSPECPSDRALLAYQVMFYAGGPVFAAMVVWAVAVLLGDRQR